MSEKSAKRRWEDWTCVGPAIGQYPGGCFEISMRIPSRVTGADELKPSALSDAFRIELIHHGDKVVVRLFSELDLVSMGDFELVVATLIKGCPRSLTFDLTNAAFVSAAGYATMGRCSLIADVKIRSNNKLVSKVMAICGFDG